MCLVSAQSPTRQVDPQKFYKYLFFLTFSLSEDKQLVVRDEMNTLDIVTLPKGELRALSEKINMMDVGLPCKWDYKDYKNEDYKDLGWGDQMFLIEDHFFFLDSCVDYFGDDYLELVAMAPYKGSKMDPESAELLSDWVVRLEDKLKLAEEVKKEEERRMKEEREARRLTKEAKREEKEKRRMHNERAKLEKRQEEDSDVDSNLRRRCREGNDAFIAGNWSR